MNPSSSTTAEGALPGHGAHDAHGDHHDHPSYLVDGTTIKSWLLTVDHKRIAIMYLVWILLFFLVGGIFAMAIRLGGTVSGEHGIGLLKRGQLRRQWPPAALAAHRAIKAALDPKGLLNPGKKQP